MRVLNYFSLAVVLPVALAQTLAPSPTESVGCEPHGDHWHCQGARTTTLADPASVTVVTETTASHASHDDEHTGTLPPSPTESVGCEPHGDHWHCSAPATGAVVTSSTSRTLGPSPTESAGCVPHGDHWHCSAAATVESSHVSSSLPPSPTESTGCQPHGDHWHCSGPVETLQATTTTAASSVSSADASNAGASSAAASSILTAGAAIPTGALEAVVWGLGAAFVVAL